MRTKLVTIALAGGLGLASAVAVPGLALAQDAQDGSSSSVLADRVQSIRDALAGLVSGGTITQEQADSVADALADSDALRPGPGGHGPRGGPVSLEAAAEVLGLGEDELRSALREGSSLAQVADEQGVERADLVSALVEAAQERLDEAVAEGRITQEQADARAEDLQARVEEHVDRAGLGKHGRGGRGGREHAHPHDDGATDGATPSPSTSGSTSGTSA